MGEVLHFAVLLTKKARLTISMQLLIFEFRIKPFTVATMFSLEFLQIYYSMVFLVLNVLLILKVTAALAGTEALALLLHCVWQSL